MGRFLPMTTRPANSLTRVCAKDSVRHRMTVRVCSKAMTQADRIRQFVLDRHVAPARARGRSEVTVRAGDVHRDMGLSNAMPAVCAAIDSKKFSELARATQT